MSIVVDSIVDQYPMETLSFDNLSQDSPISYLDYGGILSQIGELVREKRKENRDQRRDFLIKKINNVNLGLLVDKIKMEAQHLESYRAKEWIKGPSSKANYLKFFQSHDISLKYLEDMYMIQSKGKPVIEKNALIKIKENSYSDAEYGVVVDVNQSNISYVSVNKYMKPVAATWNGSYMLYIKIMNVWKCEVVGEYSRENWKLYDSIVRKYERNMKCREEFWKNHPVLRYVNIPYGYYDRRYDVLNGKLPIRMWPGQTHIWNIFEGCIKKAKKDRWIYFCKVRKISLIEENPNISENELLPLISSEWKNMSNDDKNEYYKYI